jgi:hypothetical protein
MTVDSWWANKLGLTPQQPQTPLQAFQAPPQQQQAPQYQQQVQQPYAAPKPENFSQAMAMVQQGIIPTEGGQAAKTDPYSCPECGSPNYFSRKANGVGGAVPAPHCFGCGYNGRFTQDPNAPQARQ